jgi:hypothetical protein
MGRIGTLGSKNGREVFPFNHPQVLLPMRKDKITIIDTGILPLCTRQKKITKDYVDQMVAYETYSVLGFCQWLHRGTHFSDQTLEQTLREACAKLPDVAEKIKQPNKHEEAGTQLATVKETKHSMRHSGKGANNPNSFERQHEALLEFCRRMGRVVSDHEALEFIEKNRLYTGGWNDNLAQRRSRVRWILKRIAKTFDPSKCRGVHRDVQVGKYHQWAQQHVGRIKGRDRRDVNEYGEVVVRKSRRVVEGKFVSTFLSIVEFCLITSPNEDGSLPQVRAEQIWSRCYQNGQTTVPFDDKKWAICRDWLERQGIIKVVDRNWHRGKAMRWAVLERFHRLPEWWRTGKVPSLLEAVPLVEFLGKKRLNDTEVLNSYPHTCGARDEDGSRIGRVLVRPPP